MHAFEIAAILAAGVYFAFLAGEAVLLRKARKSLRIVIHVNGTRGKTETTRLIAAALRAGGIRTLAKTTGTEPRLILEDGRERRWRRWGAANVREQRNFLLLAARRKAEAIVVECMAVSPDAQRASTGFLSPTILVVTNARPDHEAELGTPEEALSIFAEGIPRRGAVITADAGIHPELARLAQERDAENILALPFEGSTAGHAENAGTALAVAMRLGVAREIAIQGLQGHTPDPGAFTVRQWKRPGGGFITIVDALAANDPQSTELLFRRAEASLTGTGSRLLLLANRTDRPHRALAFAHWAATQSGRWNGILLVGEPVPGLRRILAQSNPRHLKRLEELSLEPEGTIVFATGNWKTIGPALAAIAPGSVL